MIFLVTNQTNFSSDVFPYASVEECLNYCKDLKEVGLDLETTGLSFIKNSIVFLILGDRHNQYVIDSTINLTQFKDLIESKCILGHNLSFDYKFLKQIGINIKELYDTIIGESLVHMGKLRSNEEGIKKVDEKYIKRIGLDKCVNRWFGIEMSKATRKSFTKIHPLNYTTSHISYAAHDVMYLHQLKHKQEELLISRKESNILKLEMQVTIPIAEMEYEGMLLDKKAWNKIYIKNKIELEELKLQLDDSVLNDKILSKHIPEYIQTDLFEENIRKLDINWSSPLQCLILFKNILPKLESTNAIELNKLYQEWPDKKIYKSAALANFILHFEDLWD